MSDGNALTSRASPEHLHSPTLTCSDCLDVVSFSRVRDARKMNESQPSVVFMHYCLQSGAKAYSVHNNPYQLCRIAEPRPTMKISSARFGGGGGGGGDGDGVVPPTPPRSFGGDSAVLAAKRGERPPTGAPALTMQLIYVSVLLASVVVVVDAGRVRNSPRRMADGTAIEHVIDVARPSDHPKEEKRKDGKETIGELIRSMPRSYMYSITYIIYGMIAAHTRIS